MPVNPRILELMGLGQGPASPEQAEPWRPQSPWLGGPPGGMNRPPPPPAAPAERGIFGLPKMSASMSQAMLGFSSGLLSRGYGESWGQALGRGITQGTKGALASRREERAEKARSYMKTLSESGVSPDADIMGAMGMMDDPMSMLPSLLANRGATRRAETQMDFSRGQSDLSHERAQLRGEASNTRMIERQILAEKRKAGTPKGKAGDRAMNLHLAKWGDEEQRKKLGLPPGTGFGGNQKLQQEFDEYMKIQAMTRFQSDIFNPMAYGGGGGGGGQPIPEFDDPDIQ